MTSLHDRVWRALRRHGLIAPGDRVLAAVSGGSDSVAMLHLLTDLSRRAEPAATPDARRTRAAPPCDFTLAGVAHMNHLLRSAESDADEQFCRELAAGLELPFECQRVEVASIARTGRVSIEVAAHDARYAFLRAAASALQANVIALGHTRDDQAETYLLRLLRGAGSAGLAGMSPRRDEFIRPLLECSREELRAYLHDRGLAFRADASNADVGIPRNRVRHELIPLLADRFTPGIVGVLARNASLARRDEAWMSGQAEAASAAIVSHDAEDRTVIDIAGLLAQPPALALRVVRQALREVAGSRFCGLDQVESVLTIASGSDGGAPSADLPGVRVERIGGNVVLTSSGNQRVSRTNAWRYALPVPGSLRIPEAGCEISARVEPRAAWPGGSRNQAAPLRVAIASDCAGTGLFVRSRLPGDALQPLGLGGRKKLQDVLVDRKVPRAERDGIALVVDGADRILWIAGHLIAEEARVTERTQSVVILELSHLGDRE